MTADEFREIVLSFPAVEQKPHFDRIGFKITGKRMFATYLGTNNTANIFLTPKEQSVFCAMDPQNIYRVPNKWGEKGATTFILSQIPYNIIMEAISSTYSSVLNQKNKR